MDLPNPKDLKALFKVCREFGVDNVQVGELKVTFGELPEEEKTEIAEAALGPSDDDMAYWSAAPDPLATRLESKQ